MLCSGPVILLLPGHLLCIPLLYYQLLGCISLLLGSREVKSKILLLWSWGDARNGKAEMDPCGRPPETAFRITGTLSFHIFLLFPSHLNSVLLLATCLPQLGFIEVPTAQDKTCSAPAVAIGVPFQADTLD